MRTPIPPGEYNGQCPTCDGEAKVYPNSDENGHGHIYCQEDSCGWIHRNKRGVSRYVDEAESTDREYVDAVDSSRRPSDE